MTVKKYTFQPVYMRYLSTATRMITALANIIFYNLLLRMKQETVIVDLPSLYFIMHDK